MCPGQGASLFCRLMIKWRFEDRIRQQMNAFKKASVSFVVCFM